MWEARLALFPAARQNKRLTRTRRNSPQTGRIEKFATTLQRVSWLLAHARKHAEPLCLRTARRVNPFLAASQPTSYPAT